MTKLLIIRHGESESNVEKTFTGQLDYELTEKGCEQARATGEFLKNEKIDIFYASDLKRAIKTAEIIASYHNTSKIIIEPALREIYAGVWEGLKYDEIAELYPKEYDVWMHDTGNASFKNAESVKDVQKRVYACLKRCSEENDGKTLLIATHALALRCFTSAVIGQTADEMCNMPWATNASVSTFIYNNGAFELTEYSHDSYLASLKTALPKNV